MAPDPRLETGATVHVKSRLVRSAIECARLYGSSAGVKMLTGTVTAAERVKTSTNRRSTWITTRFEVPGKTYVKRLGPLNYRPGPSPVDAPPSTAPPSQSSAEAVAVDSQTTGLPATTVAPTEPTASSPALSPYTGTQAIPSCFPASKRLAEAPRVAPSVTAHGFEWRDQEEIQPIGSPVPRRTRSVRTLSGDNIAEGGDSVGYGRGRTPVDYFLAVFPQQQV